MAKIILSLILLFLIVENTFSIRLHIKSKYISILLIVLLIFSSGYFYGAPFIADFILLSIAYCIFLVGMLEDRLNLAVTSVSLLLLSPLFLIVKLLPAAQSLAGIAFVLLVILAVKDIFYVKIFKN